MTTDAFLYKLNAMEHAAAQTNPAEHDYAGKRRAVLDYVADLERCEREAKSRWEWPCDTVGKLISTLQTLPPEMPFATVYFVDIGDDRVAKVRPPSLSRETVANNRIVKYSADDQTLVLWASQDEQADPPAPPAGKPE